MTEESHVRLHEVAIVVDRDFGAKLSKLTQQYHVWIVESSANTPAIQDEWAKEPGDPSTDPLGPGATAFEAAPDETLQAMCARIAYQVEEHHGEHGHQPPWSEVRVLGTSLDPYLEKVFRNLGAVHFDTTRDGFVCRR